MLPPVRQRTQMGDILSWAGANPAAQQPKRSYALEPQQPPQPRGGGAAWNPRQNEHNFRPQLLQQQEPAGGYRVAATQDAQNILGQRMDVRSGGVAVGMGRASSSTAVGGYGGGDELARIRLEDFPGERGGAAGPPPGGAVPPPGGGGGGGLSANPGGGGRPSGADEELQQRQQNQALQNQIFSLERVIRMLTDRLGVVESRSSNVSSQLDERGRTDAEILRKLQIQVGKFWGRAEVIVRDEKLLCNFDSGPAL